MDGAGFIASRSPGQTQIAPVIYAADEVTLAWSFEQLGTARTYECVGGKPANAHPAPQTHGKMLAHVQTVCMQRASPPRLSQQLDPDQCARELWLP
jgi:hypothetical protein